MFNKTFFISVTYRRIISELPPYVLNAIKKLAPLYLISTVFEIIGLVVIFPVIKVVIEPQMIQSNEYLSFLFAFFHFSNKMSFVLFLFCSITLIFILKNLLLFIVSKKQTNIAFKLATKLAFDKYSTYLNKPYSFHNENNTAVLLRNFSQLPFELVSYLIIPFVAIINELFVLILIISGITFYNPLLFMSLIIFTAPFLMIYNSVYKKKLKEISDKRDSESSNLYKTGLQSMESFREIVVFGKRNYFKPIFHDKLKRFGETNGEMYFLNTFSPKIIEVVAILGIFSIFIAGYFFNKDLAVLAQFLIVFSIAAYRVIPSLNKIILCSNYIKSSSYIFDYFHKNEGEEVDEEDMVSTPIVFNKTLTLKDLSFIYPGKDARVLNNINLEIKKGETIGIVGASGGGKTTLLNILLRLYEETEGGIYVDGNLINKTNLEEWYKLVSYVPQNITMLDGSVFENIAFGIDGGEIDNELLNKVINQAQLEDFVKGLSDGVNTQIGEKGVKISGGQRQRIGIARALYHGGKILIFDEATSSLDSETEKELTESINSISHNEYTIIIVAHRIQTLIYCDKIYDLKNGCLSLNTSIH
jgi:ABC-type multidrug transport system fused ATPase/permease subunit